MPVAHYSTCEIAGSKRQNTVVAVCRVVPVAATYCAGSFQLAYAGTIQGPLLYPNHSMHRDNTSAASNCAAMSHLPTPSIMRSSMSSPTPPAPLETACSPPVKEKVNNNISTPTTIRQTYGTDERGTRPTVGQRNRESERGMHRGRGADHEIYRNGQKHIHTTQMY